MDFGRLHIVLLHFPIALIIAAGAAGALSLIWRREFFRQAGLYCIVAAAVMAVPTMAAGMALGDKMESSGRLSAPKAEMLDTHEALGITATVLAVAAAAVGLLRRKQPMKLLPYAYAIVLAGAVVCVALAGDWGGKLVWGENFLKIF